MVDLALWHVANTMLDRQNTVVGSAKLEGELAEYKRMMRDATLRTCSMNIATDLRDNGCEIACLDRVANETRVL